MADPITPETPFLATGNTDLARFRRAVGRTWDGTGASPLVAAAEAIHAALRPAGLTRLAAAMAWIEVKNWTWFPMATERFCLPRAANNPWAVKDAGHPSGWAHYPDLETAARAWLALVLDPRVFPPDWSLARFVARYAPHADGNDPVRYGRAAAAEIAALPPLDGGAESPPRPPAPAPVAPPWRPPRYDLRADADAARFGLTPAQRDRIVAKGYPGRRGLRPEVIVLHVQDGHTPGSLAHWLGVAASATVMVQKDGSILRVLADSVGPWTNGEVTVVSERARALMARFGRDLNPVSLTIEAEGRPWDAMPDPQLRAIVWQVRDWLARYPWLDRDRIIRHAEIDGVNRAHCPGPSYERVMAALAAEPTSPAPAPARPPDVPPTPPFPQQPIPEAIVRRAFPMADPSGPVTRYFLDEWAANGLCPNFAWRETVDGWTYWSFPPFLLRSDGAGRVEAVGGGGSVGIDGDRGAGAVGRRRTDRAAQGRSTAATEEERRP